MEERKQGRLEARNIQDKKCEERIKMKWRMKLIKSEERKIISLIFKKDREREKRK